MKIAIEQILTQMFGFFLLVWVLRKLAWRPLLGLLDERKVRITNQLDEINLGREKVERLKKEYEAEIVESDARAQMKIQEAVQEGKKVAKEIQEKAKEESQQTLKQAQEEIKKHQEKAMQELQAKIADLVIAVASKVIGKSLTQEDHLKLVDQCISEVKDQRGR